jgi:UPF0189 protein in tap1-dppD intergenic region
MKFLKLENNICLKISCNGLTKEGFMNQRERREYLLKRLIEENSQYIDTKISDNDEEQKWLLRALFNVRPPKEVDSEFLRIQDEYLKNELKEKGIIKLSDLKPLKDRIYLWQGDITTLATDAIVNAANSAMLGCFIPNHRCIDNAIHTYAGIQLRLSCNKLMTFQGKEEETGKAKITPAFNLPSKYIIHTVGPIVYGELTKRDRKILKSCYYSCLKVAENEGLKSIAFCCISTGEFHFPNEEAAKIAVDTVYEYRKENNSETEVVFNVFKDRDYEIYRRLLGQTE